MRSQMIHIGGNSRYNIRCSFKYSRETATIISHYVNLVSRLSKWVSNDWISEKLTKWNYSCFVENEGMISASLRKKEKRSESEFEMSLNCSQSTAESTHVIISYIQDCNNHSVKKSMEISLCSTACKPCRRAVYMRTCLSHLCVLYHLIHLWIHCVGLLHCHHFQIRPVGSPQNHWLSTGFQFAQYSEFEGDKSELHSEAAEVDEGKRLYRESTWVSVTSDRGSGAMYSDITGFILVAVSSTPERHPQ